MKFRILQDFYGFYLQYFTNRFIGWLYVKSYFNSCTVNRIFATEKLAYKHAEEMVAKRKNRVVVKEFELK
jgi:hypothetical protein